MYLHIKWSFASAFPEIEKVLKCEKGEMEKNKLWISYKK